jgi:hypothetical protein
MSARYIPFRDDTNAFIEYFEQTNQGNLESCSMRKWISRFDGAIPLDLQRNYHKLGPFLVYISTHIGLLLQDLRVKFSTDHENQRRNTIMEVEQMLKAAMSNSGFESYGNVNWMASIVISDVEEFVGNPFGPINANSTPKGSYSEYGHIMINNGSDVQHSYQGSLQEIVELQISVTKQIIHSPKSNTTLFTRHGNRKNYACNGIDFPI